VKGSRVAQQDEIVLSGPKIFDRKLLHVRQARARSLGPATFLLDRAATELGERLSAVLRRFEVAVDLGTPTDAVRRTLAASGKVGAIIAAACSFERDSSFLRVATDEEALPFADRSLDLVVSVLALQFVNDLPGTLIQIRRALKPDGLMLAALIGGETLTELREAITAAETEIEGGLSPRVAPFADVRELGALLQRAGFALPVIDSERLVVRYDSIFALVRDLRHMGATNVLRERRRKPLKRTTVERMAQVYAERFADADGRLRASFEILWLSGWAPHESQQKPLKPGSAVQRLSDALNTREISTGEKPGRSG
jgi:SAM-dependent methyltransferase